MDRAYRRQDIERGRMTCSCDSINSVIPLDWDQDDKLYIYMFLSIASACMLQKLLEPSRDFQNDKIVNVQLSYYYHNYVICENALAMALGCDVQGWRTNSCS